MRDPLLADIFLGLAFTALDNVDIELIAKAGSVLHLRDARTLKILGCGDTHRTLFGTTVFYGFSTEIYGFSTGELRVLENRVLVKNPVLQVDLRVLDGFLWVLYGYLRVLDPKTHFFPIQFPS